MMKHLYVENQKPSNIYTEVDGKAKKWRKAWIATSSSSYTKVWDISENEYLKVDTARIGQKFLESYSEQSVSTSVYWVHQVNGEEVETYISTSEFESWQCETLEPYMFSYGGRKYVGYYQIDKNTTFGQHDMKITYKSPESGNILSVEYPIYYLEEVALDLDSYEYTWYPFRFLFAECVININNTSEKGLVCPSGIFTYQCYDKKNNLIEDTFVPDLSIKFASYQFPKPENARYRFGDMQAVKMSYLSNSGKTWIKYLIVNVRPYTDEQNQCKSGEIYHKDISALQMDIKLEEYCFETTRDIFNSNNNYIRSARLEDLSWDEIKSLKTSQITNENDENYKNTYHYVTYRNIPVINPKAVKEPSVYRIYDSATGATGLAQADLPKLESADTFQLQADFFYYLSQCEYTDTSGKTHHLIDYNRNTTVVVDAPFVSNYGNFCAFESDDISSYDEVSSLGYIYWGDGTFDIYSFTDYCHSFRAFLSSVATTTKSYNSDTDTTTVCGIYNQKSVATLANGRKISDESIIQDYEENPLIVRIHTYEEPGNYSICITCNVCADDDVVKFIIAGTDIRERDRYNTEVEKLRTEEGYSSDKWYNPALTFVSSLDKIQECAKNSYYFTDLKNGTSTGAPEDGKFPPLDRNPIAECIDLGIDDYIRPVRFLTYTTPLSSNIWGINITNILTRIVFGKTLVFKKNNSQINKIKKYSANIKYNNISMFPHDIVIDIENIDDIYVMGNWGYNPSYTLSISDVYYNYTSENIKDTSIVKYPALYTDKRHYFSPIERTASFENPWHEKGVSIVPTLMMYPNQYYLPNCVLPSSPNNIVLFAKDIILHKDSDTGETSYTAEYVKVTPLRVICKEHEET